MTGRMTETEAQALQDGADAAGAWLMRFVSISDPEYPGRAVAWAVKADGQGGTRMPGLLVAASIDEVRAMLSTALTRRDRTPMMSTDVVETWD